MFEFLIEPTQLLLVFAAVVAFIGMLLAGNCWLHTFPEPNERWTPHYDQIRGWRWVFGLLTIFCWLSSTLLFVYGAIWLT